MRGIMYGKYDYVIKSVISKREDGYVNKYHSRIVGSRCAPGLLEIGFRGSLLIEVFNPEDTHWRNWYYTSPVKSVEKNGDKLIIETVNSTYILDRGDDSET